MNTSDPLPGIASWRRRLRGLCLAPLIGALALVSTTPAALAQAAEKTAEQLALYQAWSEFADQVKEMGKTVLRDDVPATALEQAEGYRYLLAQLSEQIEVALYHSDLNDPLLRSNISKFRAAAMPSSDGRYLTAQIDYQGSYRLWGKLGTAQGNISFQFYSDMTAQEGRTLSDFADMEGAFDIRMGGQPTEENWVPLPDKAEMIYIREYFSDWDTESRSQFYLDRLDRQPGGAPLSPEKMTGILKRVSAVWSRQAPFFMRQMISFRTNLENRVMPAALMHEVGFQENIYGPGWFKLQPDEALVLTVDQSEAYYWSVQLGNFWGEALDFVTYSSSISGAQAQLGSDGKYWLVIARQDPGVPNWIDTAGHAEGFIFTRFQGIKASPPQAVKLVKLDKLRDILPAGTPAVTTEQRRQELRRRQDHMVRRWSP